MIATRFPHRQKLILDNVSWREYTRLLRTFEGRHLRLTYDRGTLEIMTPCYEHESTKYFLTRFLFTLTEELNMPLRTGGSITLRNKAKRHGLAPGNCFWIANEEAIRGKPVIKLIVDPPPDLAIEVDVSRSSMNRMRIYAAIQVPEVWRWDKNSLAFLVLNADGKHESVVTSPTFPVPISPADLVPFLAMRGQMDDNAVIRQFRTWIRAKLAAVQP